MHNVLDSVQGPVCGSFTTADFVNTHPHHIRLTSVTPTSQYEETSGILANTGLKAAFQTAIKAAFPTATCIYLFIN